MDWSWEGNALRYDSRGQCALQNWNRNGSTLPEFLQAYSVLLTWLNPWKKTMMVSIQKLESQT